MCASLTVRALFMGISQKDPITMGMSNRTSAILCRICVILDAFFMQLQRVPSASSKPSFGTRTALGVLKERCHSEVKVWVLEISHQPDACLLVLLRLPAHRVVHAGSLTCIERTGRLTFLLVLNLLYVLLGLQLARTLAVKLVT